LAPLLQAHQASLLTHINNAYAVQAPQNTYGSPNVITNAVSQLADDIGSAANTSEVKLLRGTVAVAASVTHLDRDVVHGSYLAIALTFHAANVTATTAVHIVGSSIAATGHAIGSVFSDVFGFFASLTHVSAIIRPANHTPTPVIARIRAQQAAIIQSGTERVSIPTISSGVGGACDIGGGNGSYPMSWCNTPMDSVATIPYSSDTINRECTSYAYWYFTSVEGNTNFRVWGNAKYWATSSNYPTHATPEIGAIAVETAGAYGHVAIVQALPGQEYSGQVVPAGYVLVSEMNYDWQGHFRFSYSPLSKFSTYIYQ
jgi:hypothetical protein